MFRLILISALVTLAFASHFNEEFKAFKVQHNKLYAHPKEESYRFQVFSKNMKMIQEHNARAEKGLESYRMGVNPFTDLTFEEFSRQYLGAVNVTERPSASLIHVDNSVKDLPASIDWREKGIVNPIKDQAACGSCWAFSTTASIEGAWAQAKGELVSLSEQNLMDCSYEEGNNGCGGGLMDNAFSYVIKNGGIATEDSYAYTAKSSNTCSYNKANRGATISKFVDIKSRDEDALKNAVAERVVSIAIHADSGLQHYESGIFYERFCPGYEMFLNHGVAVVGYGEDHWIVRNSWGTVWGEQGYARFAMGKNLCGIATKASYPIV